MGVDSDATTPRFSTEAIACARMVVDWFDERAIVADADEIAALVDAVMAPKVRALRALLSCAELNQDSLEPETRAAVEAARKVVG